MWATRYDSVSGGFFRIHLERFVIQWQQNSYRKHMILSYKFILSIIGIHNRSNTLCSKTMIVFGRTGNTIFIGYSSCKWIAYLYKQRGITFH